MRQIPRLSFQNNKCVHLAVIHYMYLTNIFTISISPHAQQKVLIVSYLHFIVRIIFSHASTLEAKVHFTLLCKVFAFLSRNLLECWRMKKHCIVLHLLNLNVFRAEWYRKHIHIFDIAFLIISRYLESAVSWTTCSGRQGHIYPYHWC